MSAERLISVGLGFSILASIGLVAIYILGGQPQVEGVLLGVALGGLGASLVVWAVALVNPATESEEVHPLGSPPGPAAEEAPEGQEATAAGDLTRRHFLLRLVAGAVTALAAALAIPVFSLGPQPGRALFRTDWDGGARVVGADGEPVRAADLEFHSVRTVFPEDKVGSPDAQTLLIRVRPGELALPAGRDTWAPEGCVAYSKVCTHAGCPVGLYRAEDHALFCPCHQSTFDVLRGAVPTFGPAERPLPQLPLELDADGFLVATADFPEPVGPPFWNMTHDGEAQG
jgi:ubiquinol-cytochrome c reductase iron-sulfur subunit